MPDHGECRSCHRPIMWAKTAATGSPMPLDPEPVDGGNIVLVDEKAVALKGTFGEEQYADLPRYKSHFSSCPNAKKHRKAKP